MVVGLYGHVGSLLGQRRRLMLATSIVGSGSRLAWPMLVSCVAYPFRRQSIDKNKSLSALCRAPWGCGAGWTSKRPSCTAHRVLEHVLR